MNTSRNKLIPLAEGEALALFAVTLYSQAFLLLLGCALCMVSFGISTGNWFDATIGLAWLRPIATSLTVLPAPVTIAAGCVAALIFFVIAWLNERRAYKTKTGRQSIKAVRQGIDGELPRLPLVALIVLFALIGFIEELLFRYAIFSLTETLLSSFLPAPLVLAIALLISSLAFCLAHVRYQSLSTIAVVFAMGFLFGAVFAITNSLAIVALAHGLYDFAVVIRKRFQMKCDPDYFNGEVPTRTLLNEQESKPKSENTLSN